MSERIHLDQDGQVIEPPHRPFPHISGPIPYPSLDALLNAVEAANALRQAAPALLLALQELSSWRLNSLCVDGTHARTAAQSLANARRYARAAIAAAEATPQTAEPEANGA